MTFVYLARILGEQEQTVHIYSIAAEAYVGIEDGTLVIEDRPSTITLRDMGEDMAILEECDIDGCEPLKGANGEPETYTIESIGGGLVRLQVDDECETVIRDRIERKRCAKDQKQAFKVMPTQDSPGRDSGAPEDEEGSNDDNLEEDNNFDDDREEEPEEFDNERGSFDFFGRKMNFNGFDGGGFNMPGGLDPDFGDEIPGWKDKSKGLWPPKWGSPFGEMGDFWSKRGPEREPSEPKEESQELKEAPNEPKEGLPEPREEPPEEKKDPPEPEMDHYDSKSEDYEGFERELKESQHVHGRFHRPKLWEARNPLLFNRKRHPQRFPYSSPCMMNLRSNGCFFGFRKSKRFNPTLWPKRHHHKHTCNKRPFFGGKMCYPRYGMM